MPWTCREATREWQAFIAIANERMDLDSDNTTHIAVQGVSLAFRTA